MSHDNHETKSHNEKKWELQKNFFKKVILMS